LSVRLSLAGLLRSFPEPWHAGWRSPGNPRVNNSCGVNGGTSAPNSSCKSLFAGRSSTRGDGHGTNLLTEGLPRWRRRFGRMRIRRKSLHSPRLGRSIIRRPPELSV
jgi:hypothetical protein